MPITRPYVTKYAVAYGGDSAKRRLSLAVLPIDSFTERVVSAPIAAALKELPEGRPIANQSGYMCFEGPVNEEDETPLLYTDGNYTLVVKLDPTLAAWFLLEPPPGQPWSAGFERDITLPLPDRRNPLLEIRLAPTVAYPFPLNATLLRGRVARGMEENAPRIPGALVETSYRRIKRDETTVIEHAQTLSDGNGEFVLFFKSLSAASQQINVRATKEGRTNNSDATINEGATSNVIITLPF